MNFTSKLTKVIVLHTDLHVHTDAVDSTENIPARMRRW